MTDTYTNRCEVLAKWLEVRHDVTNIKKGDLPNEGEVATICLRKLLNEAMEARLECVKPLLDLIK